MKINALGKAAKDPEDTVIQIHAIRFTVASFRATFILLGGTSGGNLQ
jgi:hypothetical protein